MIVTFQAIDEPMPGSKWQALFRRFWPSYREWFFGEEQGERPPRVVGEKRLKKTMPELVPTYRRLLDLAGGENEAARFLTMYCPAPYLTGCSQAVWSRGEPALVRNYDYSPRLWEGVLLSTEWNGRRVLAMSDCLWGALDGMNDDGLVVSLAFGGRKSVGRGFGCPLILRYVLEFCSTSAEAVRVLERVPSHMAYNVTVLDAAGEFYTVWLGPDRPPVVRRQPVATNHQENGDWSRYVEATGSIERERFLTEGLHAPATGLEQFAAGFERPPLLNARYGQGLGTLYTAVYRPTRGVMELRWPAHRVRQSLDGFQETALSLRLA